MSFNVTVKLSNETLKKEFDAPVLLSEALRVLKVDLAMPCGGGGRCGKCRVKASGALSEPGERERALLKDELLDGTRLACMATAHGDAEVTLLSGGGDSILKEGFIPRKTPDKGVFGAGLAVDIGTTTVVCYLYDLSSGALLAADSMLNPQGRCGADVISRIDASMKGAAEELADLVVGAINELSKKLAEKAGIATADIARASVAGNTAMMYLLTKKDPKSIAFVPFIPDDYFGRKVAAKQLGLCIEPDAPVYLMRSISAYVGGDITASILSSDMLRAKHKCAMLMDIGTNGEIALLSDGALNTCSTAAGPALEGAGISCGMTASNGAVDRVYLTDGELRFTVIGGGEARGVCGTGIIDAVAALLRLGAVDETGRFCEEGHAYVSSMTEVDGQPAFRLLGTEIAITQKDIRSVQLAKSAISAGALSLLHSFGLKPDDVKTLYIAGGFGSYIDAENAEFIGLIPPGLAARTTVLGNAAGSGAVMTLLSEAEREYSEQIARSSGNLELSTDPFFSNAYMDGMMFDNAVV